MSHRFDNATAGIYLENELRHVLPQVYNKVYAEIPYTRIIPVSNEVPEGAETYKYDVWDFVGNFDLISDMADDLPTSDVKRGEVINNIKVYGGSFQYTFDELRKAAYTGKSIDSMRAMATRTSYEQRANQTALFGRAGTGLKGFFNHPTVDKLVVTGTTGWFDSPGITGEEMRRILDTGITAMIANSRMVEKPDTILMPFTAFRTMSITQNSDATDTTVLEYFLKTNPFITAIEPINELDPGNSFNNLTTPRIVIYKRDPEKLKFHIPMPIKFHPPEVRGLVWKVAAEAKFGGMSIPFPKSVLYVDKG